MSKADKMIRENYEMSKNLNEENDIIYRDIVCYIRVSLISSIEKEEIISDILEMFLRYQCEGKPLDNAIGHDYKAFCDSIIDTSVPNSFSIDNIKEKAYIVINGVFILLSIDFVFNYIFKLNTLTNFPNYHINIGTISLITIIVICSFFVVTYIGKTSFKRANRKSSKRQNFLFGMSFAIFNLCLGLIAYFLRSYTVLSLNPYVVFITLVIFWIYILTKHIINRKQLVH